MVEAKYIKRIEIDSLWSGRKHIDWHLRPDVNILSGINGIGKSTILNESITSLNMMMTDGVLRNSVPNVHFTFEPAHASSIKYDVIRSFDRPLLHAELMEKLADKRVNSELDWQLYQLQRRYLDFQVNLSNQMVALFTAQDPDAQEKAQLLAQEKTHFQDMVDGLFHETGKTIQRDKNELYFTSFGESISPYKLSSGEKQMLIILLSVLVQNKRHYTLFMDEPEVSLHVEWQQQLISLIRDLNPNAQVILTTHSPAVIMNGWADCVTDVEDIVS